eukprot:CAMPEP_0179127450 /NCGR_PEP_ID=MMETSP0796-20121207/60377_1 /TAXON_ID=73915 /ORGANISM="Pyrodinium bahamense, Strain pbaha01" /LENGTH=256 /DNA_ID=CAMNT_0020826243 /DNA_START=82 /DNA_END=852 /DNA_ORIENTATION=-
MAKLLALALVLAPGSALCLDDATALWQVRPGQVKRAEWLKIGDRVQLDGYLDDYNAVVVGAGVHGYDVYIRGVGLMRNVKKDAVHRATTTRAPRADPAAGPVKRILGLKYHKHAKPVVTGPGTLPDTWNVHIHGFGDIRNVKDSLIEREDSWYYPSSTAPQATTSKAAAAGADGREKAQSTTPSPEAAATPVATGKEQSPRPMIGQFNASLKEEVLTAVNEILRVGPKEYLREKLPSDLGKVLVPREGNATLEESP